MSEKLIFSGHETFHCKNLWLKKGYDFVKNEGKFTDEACIDLGVGRNMVSSIRFWLKAFGIIDLKTEKTTEFANFLFDENVGYDKYLEDETSLWLLHYYLIVTNYSSIYSIIFNSFRKLKPEFDKSNFITYIEEIDSSINQNTLSKDYSVFLRTYDSKDSNNKEDSFSGIFSDLELIHEVKKKEGTSKFSVSNNKNIAIELILFIILENKNYGLSISFKDLYSDFNSVGNIFAFNNNQLEKKLIEISEKYPYIIYSNEAGIKELQFKKEKPNSFQILKEYYE
ncbi:DUF4007 family protein [Polaribacter sp.]|uniref:DUF4007 family protein n=1 Tax=Polaribacter sp. TaxID=1920175 RepID=UPI0035C820A6